MGASSPPPPPPPVGFWFLYMHSNPISRFLAMPKNTRQYSTYIGLRLLVDKYGVSGGSPPPDRVLIRVHAFEPHFKIHGFVNGYTSVTPPILVYDCWSTNTGCMGGAPPPPPPRRVLIHVHAFETHIKIPGYMPILYVSVTPPILVYDCRSTNYGVRGVPPSFVGLWFMHVHAFKHHFKILGYANAYV